MEVSVKLQVTQRVQHQRGFWLPGKERCRDTGEKEKKNILGHRLSVALQQQHIVTHPLQGQWDRRCEMPSPQWPWWCLPIPAWHSQPSPAACGFFTQTATPFLPKEEEGAREPQGYLARHSSTVTVTQGLSQASVPLFQKQKWEESFLILQGTN